MDNEKELKDLTDRVIAAGGRAGRKSGTFLFDYAESEGYKRGDEHSEVDGLYFWSRSKTYKTSQWVDFMILQGRGSKCKSRKSDDLMRIESEVIAAGGEAGITKGFFLMSFEDGYNYSRGGEHKEIEGLFYWVRDNRSGTSRWVDRSRLIEYRRREYDRGSQWYNENKQRHSENLRRWERNNKTARNAIGSRRRARKLEAFDPTANQAIIDSRYEAEEYLNTVTGHKWEVDHTQALKHGGKDHENNMQVVPMSWNRSKGAHHNNRWEEDSDIYRYATAVEKRFEREAIAAQGA